MFAAFKYHSTDYLYESIARQKFSICRLSLCFPPCLHQDEKYHLTGLFADDKYRRPWTRIISTQNMTDISVLDQWKKSLSVEDFLEKKPISCIKFHINKELIEVIPSSNPCSQTDLEASYLLMKNIYKEEFTEDEYLKTDCAIELKEQYQDLYVGDELVFVDNLENYGKKLPNLYALLDRLQFFLVKDPLLNSEGQKLTEESIFRKCFTFQNKMEMQESKKELQGIKENFSPISLKDEEYSMLPLELEVYRTSRSEINIPSHLELKELLKLAPETMGDEATCEELIKGTLNAEIANKSEISKYCPELEEVCSSNSRSVLDFCESAKCAAYPNKEMEVPLSPPCRQQRSQLNFLDTGLQEEPLSANSIFITEPSREYLECLVWQSEKYQDDVKSLLLKERQTVKLTCQHRSLTELKELLSVDIETPMLSSLEVDWWLHLGLSPVSLETLEQLSLDSSSTNSFLPTEVETFSLFTSYQLEWWLEEKNSMANQELLSAEKHQLDKITDLYMSPEIKRKHFSLHVSAASSVKIRSANTSIEELTGESIQMSKVEEPIYFLNQEKKIFKSLESVSYKDVSFEQDDLPRNQKPSSVALAATWYDDDSDLLSNFIMLRSKHTFTQREKKNDIDSPEKVLQLEEEHLHVHKEDSSVCKTVTTEKTEQENENITVSIQASESQCQAYCLLEAAAAPILKDLTHLGILAAVNWSFINIKFDHTRFFLKQQEKVISDHFKEGKIDEKETMLFRHAALVHLLVTVRDLLLTCGLDTALGYLSKAKDIYKNILESCLDKIWRQLKIVQYSSQKKHETNPKITALQCQMLNCMQSNREECSVKILIITRMDSDREKAALIHSLSTVEGLKAMDLNTEKKGAFLGCKDIISNFSRYSCVIVHNQHIGADFPWTHFSLVMEYDYSENSCWKNLCKNLNITYMTFKTTLPETILMGDHCDSFLLEVQIPYVFLTSEGLVNVPDILQLLETKYNITFVERSCSYSLWLFGSTDRYVVLTIDECTAIFLQNIDELNYEKSCNNVIMKLMALSLQYTCCWIVFYSRERLTSEYSLRGATVLHLVLIYATLVQFAQRSEDFEVKVVLLPGTEETALLIRQIADNILIASNINPHEWLDKSWLSILPSETEKCLLTFPCINPLVAQFMLKKGSSLKRLFLASFNQLQELLPQVPKKVLKHFSDITSLYSLNPAAPPEVEVKCASPPKNWNSFNTLCPNYNQNYQSSELHDKGPSDVNSEAMIPPLNHQQDFINSDFSSYMQKKSCSSDAVVGKKQDFFVVPKDYEDFAHPDVKNSVYVQRQPFMMYCSSDHYSKNSEEDFFATFSEYASPERSKSFLEEFRDVTSTSPEILIDETPWNDYSSTCTYDSFAPVDSDELQSLNFHQRARESSGKREKSASLLLTEEKNVTDFRFAEVPQGKKRRLTFERVPGRSDGQTRLKFF
ncbi:protein shortage in chiasmata 1 ortholog [Apteryx rowi]|uniref:protein shortage in chiasmata 1 ortholog n=1 Tax=Apteryx rowi TaxID=308060 RepID=UPI000E1DF662|nr:protein shortage in chiasmata 1 ortholog [Apteryx rowi]